MNRKDWLAQAREEVLEPEAPRPVGETELAQGDSSALR